MKQDIDISIENIAGCFKTLDNTDIAFLNKNKTQIKYLKGETLFKQGAFAPHILFVNKGLVKVFLQTGLEKQVNLHLARQGDFMAFSSIFNKNTYEYSAVALSDASICMIEKEALKKVLMKDYSFAMEITSRNYQYETRHLEIIKSISYKQMRGKLASALLYLTTDHYKDDNVFHYLSRQDIADFASITVESAVKFLKEFEKEQLIKLEGKNIVLNDKQTLEDICIKG